MKQSILFSPTLREIPTDVESISHQLLLRAGFIRQHAAGIYSFLPLGLRVLQKISSIIREEMENVNAIELLMPALQPAELWQESGRWYSYGPELMRINDRHQREFALGATHEEIITSLLHDEIKSYKKLPLTLYQIQTKFRDEKRPRYGLLRGREFLMKDAYSFHSSLEDLNQTYQQMFEAYTNIFNRCGLNFRAVIADSGDMGGEDTHEFMALSDIGEDTIAYSDSCDFAANIEMAPVNRDYKPPIEDLKQIAMVSNSNLLVSGEIEKYIKPTLFKIDEKYVVVLIRGDHEVNEIKVKNYYKAKVIELDSFEKRNEVINYFFDILETNESINKIEIIADHEIENIVNGYIKSNADNLYYVNVNPKKDLPIKGFADLRFIQEGDSSPNGKGSILFKRGIEIGHIFKLGIKYSQTMNAYYLDENGKSQPIIMGCYGIGISRTLATIAEQFHDERGLIWPINVAPFQIHIIPVNNKDSIQHNLALALYKKLRSMQYEVLLDDRSERPGVKFADSDLYGIPVRIVVGKDAINNKVELKFRHTNENFETSLEDLMVRIQCYFF
ncbi:proline--tRNA ligase [Bacillus wiedmannii]|uniref:proline--tRNA ligase n=1 Tax=Bacillus wiedmannii TaxID=1890302 RepID=UPI000BEF9363|nr:proline--tRNA ligase [Bacillus wiedmannii]MED3330383.1 proline--tRNA ligase [Bacillus thuringiensis]PEJ68553.1 proline--tRNA ligase [Bacillus wiedmannii]